jgi:hypothetical protein
MRVYHLNSSVAMNDDAPNGAPRGGSVLKIKTPRPLVLRRGFEAGPCILYDFHRYGVNTIGFMPVS